MTVQYKPPIVQSHSGGVSDRESVASLANTDKVKMGNGNMITLEAAIEKIRTHYEIPEPTQKRNDPCSDKGVILSALGFLVDIVNEEKAEAAKFADSK